MQVRFTKVFLKEVEQNTNAKLASSVNNIIQSIKAADSLMTITNMKKLTGYKNAYRIRTGDYRIGMVIENDMLIFSRFMHRKDIYKFFP
ncbi:MAG: type II toxin-antitoxin system RelE/ParE family toxin [Bacteroidia bacterium]